MITRSINFLRHFIGQVRNTEALVKALNNDLKSPKVNLGQIQASLNRNLSKVNSLQDVEFQVFSQWGDDGIIQFLIDKIDIRNKTFIEFGVENYKESNTRFLLINNNWSGLVIDGSLENVNYIKNDNISWAHDIHAYHSFITKENINDTIQQFLSEGYSSEIGILSIDIDGVDYWVWQEINVVNPVLVIVEYNSAFGLSPWTVPYQADFYRHNFKNPYQYWGASLAAFNHLAQDKGYTFIGCNSAGNNAYFLRNDKLVAAIPTPSLEEGYVEAKFREYSDGLGKRVGGKKGLRFIYGATIFNVEKNEEEVIA